MVCSNTKLAYCKTLAHSLSGKRDANTASLLPLILRFDSLINAYFWHAEELAASRIPAGCISGCPLHSLHSQHKGAAEKSRRSGGQCGQAMATNDDAAMSAAVKAASDEVLQAAAAVTKACNALDPADGAKWAQRLDRVLDAVDAYAGAPPKGAPSSSAVDATAGRLFGDIESALADHDRAKGS